ncbi:phosphatase and actin regulator 2 [Trichonephila clavipes]|nr:phosphatase and actin regulator 2 [Trichonephila clavipes]
MCINLKNDIPVCQRARRLSCTEKLQTDGMLRRIFEPWQWKRRKKRDRFEQTSRTLERKISMRSTKDQLIKKGFLMPDRTDKNQDSKINVFLLNLPDVEEVPSHDGKTVQFSSGLDEKGKKEDVPLRTAYSQAGRLWHPANPVVLEKNSVFARRRSKSKPEQKHLDIREEQREKD